MSKNYLRIMVAAALAAGLCAGASAAEALKLRVIGQPLATGLIQAKKEQPFFEKFKESTGLPIEMDYKPIDTLGIKDTEELRVLKSGLFEMASLRFPQNARDEPTLLGFDLVGLNPDYPTARKVVDAFYKQADERLQKQFGVKLLGVFPFGPQILFCNKPITKLADIKGLKVRVYDQNLAKFIDSLGGTPVPISFADTHQSLSLGVVDCAITGPSSANSSGWPEVTTHQLPIGFQMAINGYVITKRAWDKLSSEQQTKLQAAVTAMTNDIWTYSEALFKDAVSCNAGKACETGKKFKLVDVPVSDADRAMLKDAVTKVSLPAWSDVCNKVNKGCVDNWKTAVGPVVGIK
ncbi:ABC transporter substrate-binding protein [Pusillimonas sp. TS35]|uniref:TRAP transporter substrate-binding protein n=1 Tax=Paracandidimonas lactea TaxID=2895524 RepID=UPI00136C5150|nr:TRAP transporter substrate-binding protein [Paracandidimonas lactea]MYN12821.1 ABC transporter substrate-binding protein [Pusillimonas sp. TS35]